MGRKGFIFLTLPGNVHHRGKSGQKLKQGRKLEEGADAEAMEGAACWLAPHGLLSLLSFNNQDHQPRDDTTHTKLGPSIARIKKVPYGLCLNPYRLVYSHNTWRHFLH